MTNDQKIALEQLQAMPKEALKEVTDNEIMKAVTAKPAIATDSPTLEITPAQDRGADIPGNTDNMAGSIPTQLQAQQQAQQLNMGELLSPTLVVELIDALLPAGGVLLAGMFDVKIKKSELQATAKEKEVMTKPVAAVMQQMNINTSNPFLAFGVTILAIYGSKVAEKIVTAKMEDKKAEPEFAPVTQYNENSGQMEVVYQQTPKKAYTGAKRGPKPKNKEA